MSIDNKGHPFQLVQHQHFMDLVAEMDVMQ